MSHLFSPPISARLSCLPHLIYLDWFQLFPLLLPLLGCQKRSSFLHFRLKHSPTHQDSTLLHWNNSRHSRDVCRCIWLPSFRVYKSLVYFSVKLKGSRSSLKYSYCVAKPPCGSLVSTQIISEFLLRSVNAQSFIYLPWRDGAWFESWLPIFWSFPYSLSLYSYLFPGSHKN